MVKYKIKRGYNNPILTCEQVENDPMKNLGVKAIN